MTTYGLTHEGFVAKTLEEVEAGFVAQQRANIDPAIDTSQYGLVGQLNGIYASALAELWELAEAVYDAMDPDQATGQSQDALYALTNTLREGPRPSHALCTVELAIDASIPARAAIASVAGNPVARFSNVTAMVWVDPGGEGGPGPATLEIQFECLTDGPVAANAGTLTQRDTLIDGWLSVTNADDAQLGTDLESDAHYRERRVEELAAQGGGTVAGIRADLMQLPTVLAATVLENTDDFVSVDGLPPHSFEAVVRSEVGAGDEVIIATSIWSNKPAGIETYGSLAVEIVDIEGVPHTIRFSRPDELAVYVALRVTVDPLTYIGDNPLKDAVALSGQTPGSPGFIDVGDPVYAGRYVTVAMQQPGVLNAEARVSLVSDDYATGVAAIPTTLRQLGILDSTRISVVPIP